MLEVRIQELKAQDPFKDPEHVSDNAASDRDASEEEGHDRIAAQLDELSSQHDAVEQALLRIGNNSYGICSNCGKPIDEGRLRVNPTAEKCIECQKLS